MNNLLQRSASEDDENKVKFKIPEDVNISKQSIPFSSFMDSFSQIKYEDSSTGEERQAFYMVDYCHFLYHFCNLPPSRCLNNEDDKDTMEIPEIQSLKLVTYYSSFNTTASIMQRELASDIKKCSCGINLDNGFVRGFLLHKSHSESGVENKIVIDGN